MRSLWLIAIPLALGLNRASAQSTHPGENAAAIYMQAVEIVEKNNDAGIYPPCASNLAYAGYPPYPAEWHRLEEVDFRANAPARMLAHEAAEIAQSQWQKILQSAPSKSPMPDLARAMGDEVLLNPLRGLANVLADAVAWQHEQKDDAAAVETVHDLWRLAAAVEEVEKNRACLLTGIAMQDLDLERLEVVTSSIALTKDTRDSRSLQATVARQLIGELMDHPNTRDQAAIFIRVYGPDMKGAPSSLPGSIINILNSVDAERDLAAMSLGCHLYRLDTGHWPHSLHELRKYLPHMPMDPFGDGTQSLGYALIKGGLPDGSDRPLIYSRCRSTGPLSFRADEPEFCAYVGDGGQFRDVASWFPAKSNGISAITRALN